MPAWTWAQGIGLAMLLVQGAAAASPQTDAANTLPLPEHEIVLEVHGLIANSNVDTAAHFDMEMLRALPPAQLRTTTAVTDGVHQFEGFLMRDLLARLGASGDTVTASAINDYTIDIPSEEFERFDILVAHTMDGEILLPSGKGPLWIVYPRDQHEVLQDIRYDYRWVWQLNRLDIR